MEPPEGVPPSLLELADEMKNVRGNLAEISQELHEAMENDSASRDNDLWDFGKRARRKRHNHQAIRRIQGLRGEAGRIAREAWDTVRELAEARKESGAPPLPPERRKELERWMMATFGPPPREHGPFPWKDDHMRDNHPGFPGFQGKVFFEKIDRMEKRIEDLEDRVRAQEEEIRKLREVLEEKEYPTGRAD
jgi:hypothetical protein